MADDDRYQKGLANRAKVFGDEGEERRKAFEAASPDFARFVTESVYGELYERKGIDDKIRETVILAILCTLGRDNEFEWHAHAALNLGMTKEDIQEIIMVCAYYAGGPNAVGASKASLNVFKERRI
jgi:4-carboxymuconolactone decarboxylase